MLLYITLVSFAVMSKAMQPEEGGMSLIATNVPIYGKRFKHKHNNWDHLSSKRGQKELQCRVCGEVLHLPVSAASGLMHTIYESQTDKLPRCDRLNIYRWNGKLPVPKGWHQEPRNGEREYCFRRRSLEAGNEEGEYDSTPTGRSPEREYIALFHEFQSFRESTEQRISELENKVTHLEQAHQGFTTM